MEKTPSSQEFNPQDVEIEVYRELLDYLTKLFNVLIQSTLKDEYELDYKHISAYWHRGEHRPVRNSWFNTFYRCLGDPQRPTQFPEELPLENALNTLCIIQKIALEAQENLIDVTKQGKMAEVSAGDIFDDFTGLARGVEDELYDTFTKLS